MRLSSRSRAGSANAFSTPASRSASARLIGSPASGEIAGLAVFAVPTSAIVPPAPSIGRWNQDQYPDGQQSGRCWYTRRVASTPVFNRGRDLVQAGLPQDGFPAAGDDVPVTWPAAQQHVHPFDGTCSPGPGRALRASYMPRPARAADAGRGPLVSWVRVQPVPAPLLDAGTGGRWPAAGAAPPACGRGRQPGGGLADQLSFAAETLAHHRRSPGCGQLACLWKTP